MNRELNKPTPGPWQLIGSSIRGEEPRFKVPEIPNHNMKLKFNFHIVTLGPKRVSRARSIKNKANTKLVLAAPELLDACMRAFVFMDSRSLETNEEIMKGLFEAVAKAGLSEEIEYDDSEYETLTEGVMNEDK